MKAGLLNAPITIRKHGKVKDESGAVKLDWFDYAQVWANVRHNSGAESIKAESVTSVVRASVRIYYRDDITNAMRLVINGADYSIVAVMPDLVGRVYLDLVCERVA